MPLNSIEADLATSTRMSKKSFVCEKLSSTSTMENIDLDKALALTDYGRFHYKIIASCAFCLLSSGLQNGLSAYVLPAAHCELQLKSSEIGFINAAFLVGGTCSSFLWGVVADLTGRKKVLVITILLDFAITLVCSLMQNYLGLVICRFINGFLIGAPGSLTFTYLAEFHAPHHRSKSIYYSGVFFTIAWLILPTVAWLILPLEIEVVIFEDFIVCSAWRIFLCLLALPELIAGLWILNLPESPKFLATGDTKKALIVLKQMYALNTGKSENDFPVKNLMSDVEVWSGPDNGVNCRGKVARITEDVYSQISKLLKAPLLPLTLTISGIMFANMFGYFGLGLWLPELLTRFHELNENRPNASVDVDINLTARTNGSESCFPEFDGTLFQSTMAMGTSALVGNLLSGWFAGRFEYRVIPLATMFFGAISAGSIYWLSSSLQNLMAACVFQSTMSIANVALGSVIVELFPTSVSAIAMCTATFTGRIGAIFSNVIFGFLMDLYCEIALFLVAGVLLVGAVLCLMIPNDQKVKTGKEEVVPEISVISVTSM